MKDWEVAKVMHIVDIVPVPFFPVKLFCSSFHTSWQDLHVFALAPRLPVGWPFVFYAVWPGPGRVTGSPQKLLCNKSIWAPHS